jgi:hypothetical protein
MAEVDILMDMRLIKVNQVMTVPLRAIQQRGQVFDESGSSVRTGPAKQFLGFLPRQFQPMQNGPDCLAAAATGKSCLHQPNQAAQRPAWLRISADYGRAGCVLLRGAHFVIEGGGNLRAKGGRPHRR